MDAKDSNILDEYYMIISNPAFQPYFIYRLQNE